MRKFLPTKKEMQFNGHPFEVLKFCPIYIDGSIYQATSLCFVEYGSGDTMYLMIKEADDNGHNEIVFFKEKFEADCDGSYYYALPLSTNHYFLYQDNYKVGKTITSFDLLTLLEII